MTDNFFMFSRLILFHGLLFILLSCAGNKVSNKIPNPRAGATDTAPAPAPEIRRIIPKKSDPEKQARCKKVSKDPCKDNKKCEEICDDIFRRSDREKCEELPQTLVADFEDLLSDTEDGDIDEISLVTLECLLDIDERPFAKAVKEINNKRKAKKFLYAVISDEDLAEILKSEDDESVILKQLLNEASGSNDLSKQLSVSIEDRQSLLWLASEDNKYFWDWMDDYVGEQCNEDNDCPGGENIGAYCSILIKLSDKKLEEFLKVADVFAEEYQEEVTDEDYVYDIEESIPSGKNGDFRDWCEAQIPASCPADGTEPDSSQKLASLSFVPHGYDSPANNYSFKYQKNNFCEPSSSTSNSQQGSSDPDQDILLLLNSYRKLVLNKDEIDEIKTYNTDDNTYYLYIDQNRYELDKTIGTYTTYTEADGCDGDPKNLIVFQEGNLPSRSGTKSLGFTGATAPTGEQLKRDIYLASEKNGVCTYYK